MTSTLSLRQRLVDELIEGGHIRDKWVHEAFATVPREAFVPRFHRRYPAQGVVDSDNPSEAEEWLTGVYTDQPLVVQLRPTSSDSPGNGVPTSSSSQPSVMAGMLEALDLREGHRVLEIGTGTGYNAALLCQRVGDDNVTSVELDPLLADTARHALASIGLRPTVLTADGAVLDATGTFDRIIATASTDRIHPAWIHQLTPGGVILADVRGSVAGSLARLDAFQDYPVDTVHGHFLALPGMFMPLRTRVENPLRDGEDPGHLVYDCRNPQITTTELDPQLVADEQALRFLVQLHLAGRHVLISPPVDNEISGRATDGSWFNADLRPDTDGHHIVAQGGPQRLWDTVEAAHAIWRRLGEPDIDQYTITAGDDVDLQQVSFAGCRWPLPL